MPLVFCLFGGLERMGSVGMDPSAFRGFLLSMLRVSLAHINEREWEMMNRDSRGRRKRN